VRTALEEHPDWLQIRSSHGETCLHVAGIYGAAAVTRAVLQAGADPNVRSTYEHGLRMHPLSWNVYGGHVTNAQLLLEHGADPNLDVDPMENGASPETVLDIVQRILGAFDENYKDNDNQNEDSRYTAFREIEKLLLKYDAKNFAALNSVDDSSHTEL
jgi:ankyrin repeat protein